MWSLFKKLTPPQSTRKRLTFELKKCGAPGIRLTSLRRGHPLISSPLSPGFHVAKYEQLSRYAVTRGLAPPLRMSQANVNVPGEKKLLSKRDHVRQEIKNLDEALKSKTELERSRAALLREQIVSEKQALETETVLEADLLRELQSTNADLQGALQQKRAATRQGAAPLQRVQPGEKPKVAVKTVGELALTVDEAITAAILVVQNEFPNATIRPTDPKKKSTGSFRTYDINGVKALLTVRDAEVRVRSAHEWVSLPTFVAELAERFKAERERRERIEAERKAKQACKLQETIDVKMGNKQLRYRKLAEAYEREQKKAEDRQREVDGQVAKEHASVEALEVHVFHPTQLLFFADLLLSRPNCSKFSSCKKRLELAVTNFSIPWKTKIMSCSVASPRLRFR